MQLDQSLNEYLEQLASNSPTPGGGAAASLSAAQAAALFAMVARLSKGDAVDWQAHILELDQYRTLFSDLARKDALAFEQVMQAYNIPKGEERTEVLQTALKNAVQPPLETIEACWKMLKSIRPYIEAGNRNVITDSGIAVSLARAAIESSAFNVAINLKFIKDDKFSKDIDLRFSPIKAQLNKLSEDLQDLVYSRL